MDSGRESEVDFVLDPHRFGQVSGGHDGQVGTKELGQMRRRAPLDAGTDSGAPQSTARIQLLRFEQPLLAAIECRQRLEELSPRWFNDRSNARLGIRRKVDDHRRDGVYELASESLARGHPADEDGNRRGRTLLSGVSERRVGEVFCRKIKVGGLGDDHRVLAARLRKDAQVGAEFAEEFGGFKATGQDDLVDAFVGDQSAPQFFVRNLNRV